MVCAKVAQQIKRFRDWWSYMNATFSSTTLLILFLVYWSQGFKAIGSLAFTFFYKETIGLEPAETQFIRTFTIIAWLVKPLYGLSSDNLPIAGYHRKSYLLLSGVMGMASFLSILFVNSVAVSIVVFMLSELSQAIADVIADAIMVESSKLDPAKGSANLQTFSWCVLSTGGLIGSFSGGLLLELLSPRIVLSLMAVCPALLTLAAVLYKENRRDTALQWGEVAHRFRVLTRHCASPQVFKPLLFIFLSSALAPSFSELMTYFMYDELGFTESFFGLINTIGYISLFLASAGYTLFLKFWPYKRTLAVGQVVLCLLGTVDIMLVLGVYKFIGVPAEAFAVGDTTLGVVAAFAFKAMPLLVLSARICPDGVEATLFALFASVFNLGYAASGFYGAFLTKVYGVTSEDYSKFWFLLLVGSLSKLLVLPFLGLLPELIEVKSDDLAQSEPLEVPQNDSKEYERFQDDIS